MAKRVRRWLGAGAPLALFALASCDLRVDPPPPKDPAVVEQETKAAADKLAVAARAGKNGLQPTDFGTEWTVYDATVFSRVQPNPASILVDCVFGRPIAKPVSQGTTTTRPRAFSRPEVGAYGISSLYAREDDAYVVSVSLEATTPAAAETLAAELTGTGKALQCVFDRQGEPAKGATTTSTGAVSTFRFTTTRTRLGSSVDWIATVTTVRRDTRFVVMMFAQPAAVGDPHTGPLAESILARLG